MYSIREITHYLSSQIPDSYALPYDNVGEQIGDFNQPLSNVLCALDLTKDLIEEAKDKKCNLIVVHHPPLFKPLHTITTDDPKSRLLMQLIQNNIACYVAHTNLDQIHNGLNYYVGKNLGLQDMHPLLPMENDPTSGIGVVGTLQQDFAAQSFLDYVKGKWDLLMLRHTGLLQKKIRRIALITGSGGEYLKALKGRDIDACITSDLKYHDFLESNESCMLIDVGHYASEKESATLLAQLISNKFTNIVPCITQKNSDPIFFY